jgi:hypothetical protein
VRDIDAVVRESFSDPSWALPLSEALVVGITRGVRRRRRLRTAGVALVVLAVAGGASGIGVLASQHPRAGTHPAATSAKTSDHPSTSISVARPYLAFLHVAHVPAGLAAEGDDSYYRTNIGPSGLNTGRVGVRVELRRYVDTGHATLVALSLIVPDAGHPEATPWLVNWAVANGTTSRLTGVPTGDALLVRQGGRDSAVVVTTRGDGVLLVEADGRALGPGELVRIARSITWTY